MRAVFGGSRAASLEDGMKARNLLVSVLVSLLVSNCTGTSSPPASTPHASLSGKASPTAEIATVTLDVQANALTATQAPPVETSTPIPTSTPFVYAYGPVDFPEDINPLTGLVVSDPQLLERRPIVIKVTNFPRSVRPQSGLSLADHVYEYYIADNFSRFVGVFYGNDASQVGPIRSARLFDAHVTRMYHGIFIFGWADDIVLNFLFAPDLKPHLIVERPDNCPPLCRFGPRTAYNTLFADTTTIAVYLAKRRTNNDRQDVDGLRFEQKIPSSGNPGEKIAIQYSLVSYHYWEYDPRFTRYLRFQETGEDRGGEGEYAPLLDNLTQEQLSANNIIVLLVPHEYYKKSSSTNIIDQPFMGQGLGYGFRDGQVYPLTWKREAADRLPELALPDGSLYPLKPGNTWFEIIGKTSHFEQLENWTWFFEFSTP
jgi:hypothetical protein